MRRPDLVGTALGYAPLWDLVVWANEQTNAEWFDLGGITSGGPGDAQWGISEFKRYFSHDVIDVGEEWLIEPSKLRAAIARGVSNAAHWLDAALHNGTDRAGHVNGDAQHTNAAGLEPTTGLSETRSPRPVQKVRKPRSDSATPREAPPPGRRAPPASRGASSRATPWRRARASPRPASPDRSS